MGKEILGRFGRQCHNPVPGQFGPVLALPQWYSHSFCYEITSSWGGTVHISAILFPEIKELWSKLPRSIGWVWIVPRNKWDLRAKEMRTISLWWRFTHCFAGSLPSRPVPPAEDQETRFDSCFTLLFLLYVTDFIAFVKYQQGKQDGVRPRTPLALTQHKRGTSPLWGGQIWETLTPSPTAAHPKAQTRHNRSRHGDTW